MNKSAVGGDDSGADRAERVDFPPKVGAEEPGPSMQVTDSVAAEPECGHFVELDRQTSLVIGEGSGVECNDGQDRESEAVRKDAAGDAVRTNAAGTVSDGRDVAQGAVEGISGDLGDGGEGKGRE